MPLGPCRRKRLTKTGRRRPQRPIETSTESDESLPVIGSSDDPPDDEVVEANDEPLLPAEGSASRYLASTDRLLYDARVRLIRWTTEDDVTEPLLPLLRVPDKQDSEDKGEDVPRPLSGERIAEKASVAPRLVSPLSVGTALFVDRLLETSTASESQSSLSVFECGSVSSSPIKPLAIIEPMKSSETWDEMRHTSQPDDTNDGVRDAGDPPLDLSVDAIPDNPYDGDVCDDEPAAIIYHSPRPTAYIDASDERNVVIIAFHS